MSYTSFNPATKRTEAVIESKGNRFVVVKGAAQIVTTLCRDIDEETREKANKTIEELSRKGYRTLAVAASDDDNQDNLKFVGLLPLADPPRPDSKSMIEQARKLGIKPMMLTGDHSAIAKEVAHLMGIGDKIIRMTDLDASNEEEQARTVEKCDGFAEIYPEDKYRIVKFLQSRGHMVGMTGDGVNDAPALKQAEMGIAVSNSTDVVIEAGEDVASVDYCYYYRVCIIRIIRNLCSAPDITTAAFCPRILGSLHFRHRPGQIFGVPKIRDIVMGFDSLARIVLL